MKWACAHARHKGSRPYTGPVTWWAYVERVTKGQTPAEIAAKIEGNLAPSTVSRWKTTGISPNPETIFAFADAYGVTRQEALLAAYLPKDGPDAEALLASFSNKRLLEEVGRRMRDDQDRADHADTSIQTPGES